MNKWRPEGWKNPYGVPAMGRKASRWYEKGADAMLDAIRAWQMIHALNIPDDPPEWEELKLDISEVMPDNCIKLADTYYRKVGDNHPAAEVVEEGYFCPVCGEKTYGEQENEVSDNDGNWDGCWKEKRRGIRH